MERCVIVGGADISGYEYIKSQIRDDDFFIYCDGGLKHMEKLDRKPGDEVGEDDILPAGTVVRAEITGKGKYVGSKISKTFRIIETE